MIRIRRGPEPASLATARNRQLSAAVKAYNQHGHGSKELSDKLVGYKLRRVKQRLFLAQHKKCAWCEVRAQYSSSPVEHYRPKNGAHRHDRGEPPRIDHGHYWWLTWTWENLLFSCTRCNDQGHKANFFPTGARIVTACSTEATIPRATRLQVLRYLGRAAFVARSCGG